jgi:hypothetical protein
MTKRATKPFEHFWAVFDDGSVERITDEKRLEQIIEARRKVAECRDIFPQATTEWFLWVDSEHRRAWAKANASRPRKAKGVTRQLLEQELKHWLEINDGSRYGFRKAMCKKYEVDNPETIDAILKGKRDGE